MAACFKDFLEECFAQYLAENPQGLDPEQVKQAIINCFASDQAPEIDHPEQLLCRGPFVRSSNRTGWWSTFGTPNWTQVYNDTGNVPNTLGEWVNVGTAQKAPDCVTDMEFDADLGHHIIYARRNRVYTWWDTQLLVNGAVVPATGTGTYDVYHYRDERTGTNEDPIEPLQYHMEPTGHVTACRNAIPAGAIVQVQARPRYQTTASQSSNYFRFIAGLRSNTTYKFWPRDIVIGRQPAK